MDESNLNLHAQFMRIHVLFHRHRIQSHHAKGPMGDPYRGQGRVLRLLQMHPEISQKDLIFLLDMRPQSLGEVLAKLERNGYIARTALESDRRVMSIRLTEMGLEAASLVEQTSAHDTLVNCLSHEEQVELSEYLDRIIDDLEKRYGDEPKGLGCGLHESHGHTFDDMRHGHAPGHGHHHCRDSHE